MGTASASKPDAAFQPPHATDEAYQISERTVPKVQSSTTPSSIRKTS